MGKIAYNKNTDFHKTLKNRVDAYFSENDLSRKANAFFYGKVVVILGSLAALYAGIYLIHIESILWYFNWFAFGLVTLIMLLNIMHDALHGNISYKNRVNRSYGIIFKLLGLNDTIWINLHNYQHHHYSNVEGADPDLLDNGFLRLSPYQKQYFLHRYQHIYASILYSLSTIYWVFSKDFKDIRNIKSMHNWRTILDFIFFKITYLILFLVLPLYYWEMNYTAILLGFLVMHLTFGLISSYFFLSSHIVDEVDFYEANGQQVNQSWAEHQLLTTITFGRHRWIHRLLSGGLNYQVEHHLFPNICHVHYPAITDIIKDTALEFNLVYHEHPTFRSAVISHLKALKKIGRMERPDRVSAMSYKSIAD
ncbi:MAG: acyl-CoA desaturase [Bacteroidota bacterium]